MDVANKPRLGLTLKVLHFIRLVAATVGRFFISLYYGTEGEKIPPISDDILKLPAVEVAKKIRNQEITSVEVLEACIRRIKDVNSALNFFVENRFKSALKEAKDADALIRGGTKFPDELELEKPFLGVPFTTKDCIAVKGLHHTAGVVRRKDLIAEHDADAVKLLRESGAIIIGITNVPEICMWWETHNHIYGRTKNPYNTTRIVGGSSGGEGCCQAVAGSIFGIGSDIGGSIRMPAYFNGIFGHKPSRNIVSNYGQYPLPETEFQNSFLGVGPMTRFAVDLKPILKIISANNASKLNLDKPVDIRNIKFYYQQSSGSPIVDQVDKEITAAMKRVIEHIKNEHNIDAVEKNIGLLQKSVPIWFAAMKNKKKFGEFIMQRESIPNIFKELFKNLFGLSGNTFIGLFTALFDHGGVEHGTEKHKHYLGLRDNLEKIFSDMLGDNGVLLYPTHPTAALYHNEPLLRPLNFSYTGIINCLGLPATTIPLGLNSEGLPIGLQVVANHNQDRLCLAVAEELERAFGGWIEPQKV